MDKRVIEDQLRDDVEGVYFCDGKLVDHHGSESVKEDLEGAEERFSEDGVKEYGFEGGGEVDIDAIDAKGFVVGEVVRLLLSVLLSFVRGVIHTLKEAL